jgi:hypothetical protein
MRRVVVLLIVAVGLTTHVASGAAQPAPDRQALFDRMDLNKDGRIDRAEFQHWLQEAFFLLDANKDGMLALQELQQAQSFIDAGQFTRADHNRDGVLDMVEFSNTLTQDFEAADQDHDGTLNRQEFQRL